MAIKRNQPLVDDDIRKAIDAAIEGQPRPNIDNWGNVVPEIGLKASLPDNLVDNWGNPLLQRQLKSEPSAKNQTIKGGRKLTDLPGEIRGRKRLPRTGIPDFYSELNPPSFDDEKTRSLPLDFTSETLKQPVAKKDFLEKRADKSGKGAYGISDEGLPVRLRPKVGSVAYGDPQNQLKGTAVKGRSGQGAYGDPQNQLARPERLPPERDPVVRGAALQDKINYLAAEDLGDNPNVQKQIRQDFAQQVKEYMVESEMDSLSELDNQSLNEILRISRKVARNPLIAMKADDDFEKELKDVFIKHSAGKDARLSAMVSKGNALAERQADTALKGQEARQAYRESGNPADLDTLLSLVIRNQEIGEAEALAEFDYNDLREVTRKQIDSFDKEYRAAKIKLELGIKKAIAEEGLTGVTKADEAGWAAKTQIEESHREVFDRIYAKDFETNQTRKKNLAQIDKHQRKPKSQRAKERLAGSRPKTQEAKQKGEKVKGSPVISKERLPDPDIQNETDIFLETEREKLITKPFAADIASKSGLTKKEVDKMFSDSKSSLEKAIKSKKGIKQHGIDRLKKEFKETLLKDISKKSKIGIGDLRRLLRLRENDFNRKYKDI